MKNKTGLIVFVITFVFICLYSVSVSSHDIPKQNEVFVPTVEDGFLEPLIGDRLCLENVSLYLDSIGVHHSDIVVKQAILETGWLKSYSARHRNNLFGLTNGKTRKLFVFSNWKQSCIGYRDMVQYKYKKMGYDVDAGDNDYYKWLVDVHYASDPQYINKLKHINYEI